MILCLVAMAKEEVFVFQVIQEWFSFAKGEIKKLDVEVHPYLSGIQQRLFEAESFNLHTVKYQLRLLSREGIGQQV